MSSGLSSVNSAFSFFLLGHSTEVRQVMLFVVSLFQVFITLLFRKSCLPSRYLLSRIVCPLLPGIDFFFFSERFGFHMRK